MDVSLFRGCTAAPAAWRPRGRNAIKSIPSPSTKLLRVDKEKRAPSDIPLRNGCKSFISFLSVAAVSSASVSHRLDPRADAKIQWGPCNQTIVNTTLPTECADFTVPLDYTTPSSKETIRLQIARIEAKVQPARGTILINFGGPGSNGRTSLG
ncbi:hypothetical protein JDV02_003467 [Purpureocillium takamizusanense]|uniref:Uncharacterized protein n=1 Tax=Purpureocillium takamizusanense TaxID=2060973 RepID=A0A9Q8V9Q0_9HYPO|nr:uncharacterized protein JDV02_003467 [Purpureocillium takamizusanense]UNI17089.1 hypothetical protein JDV02_003467 [Purpureocillium takamizusanense]